MLHFLVKKKIILSLIVNIFNTFLRDSFFLSFSLHLFLAIKTDDASLKSFSLLFLRFIAVLQNLISLFLFLVFYDSFNILITISIAMKQT